MSTLGMGVEKDYGHLATVIERKVRKKRVIK